MCDPAKYCLRGAAGFTAGAVITALCAVPAFVMKWPQRQGPPAWTFYLLVAGIFCCGAVGAAVLTWRRVERHVTARAAVGFGIGFVAAAFVTFFADISLQGGGRPDTTWGAVAYGIGYGLGGMIGAAFLSPRLALAGAAAFALPGALGGFMSFTLAGSRAAPGNQIVMMFAGACALFVPYLVGGALFGAAVGLAGED